MSKKPKMNSPYNDSLGLLRPRFGLPEGASILLFLVGFYIAKYFLVPIMITYNDGFGSAEYERQAIQLWVGAVTVGGFGQLLADQIRARLQQGDPNDEQ
ncbi:hypothetical protein [Hyphobacterium sp.]|uniref:hypothetical protein n=1 Tax=Hyphobacterium sp. TaxID=2004662 RepID=UPI003BAD5946